MRDLVSVGIFDSEHGMFASQAHAYLTVHAEGENRLPP